MTQENKAAPEKKVPAPKVKKAKLERVTQNGIVRPADGTKTGDVWKYADAISGETKKPATRADVLAACEKAGINAATAATQYGRWCKFNGIAKQVEKKATKETPAKETPAEEDIAEDETETEEDDGDFEE